ncbi:14122_t:CDS:2 [Gigaspora margarita]|uniref:14122_t:CDS:1 n=1 Tax=Gigaspora margarita TaxID=4874 RepID=A0ABN7UNK8_GIGMA|nr:14122_t:CDS:2 [Gigaspora margarita]
MLLFLSSSLGSNRKGLEKLWLFGDSRDNSGSGKSSEFLLLQIVLLEPARLQKGFGSYKQDDFEQKVNVLADRF